jgi:transcription elongation factor Elf1
MSHPIHCPFCGNQPVIDSYTVKERKMYYVICLAMDCHVKAQTMVSEDLQTAIDFWNKRNNPK